MNDKMYGRVTDRIIMSVERRSHMEIIDAILCLLGVAGGIAGTTSAFSGAWETLFGAISTIIEFFSSFLG